MQDRFKFRATVNGSYYTKDGDEKEITLLLYDIAIYKYGEIGINSGDLLNVIQEALQEPYERDSLWQYFLGNSSCPDDDWIVITAEKIMQCTGLKDKSGKLIYEGDILAVPYIDPIFMQPFNMEDNDDVAYVKSYKGCFVVYYPEKQRKYLYDYENTAEVIGNIHENHELLEKRDE